MTSKTIYLSAQLRDLIALSNTRKGCLKLTGANLAWLLAVNFYINPWRRSFNDPAFGFSAGMTMNTSGISNRPGTGIPAIGTNPNCLAD